MVLKFPKSKRSRKLLVTGVAALSIPVAIVYTLAAIKNKPLPATNNTPTPVPTVSVVAVQAETHQARLRGDGEARPHFELTLTTQLAGRITALNPDLESGQYLGSETELVTIDPIPFHQEVAAAKQSLAEARLALLQEQREAERARAEWEKADLTAAHASPLLLREPQIEVAEARVHQAQAMLKQAEMDLFYTRVRAPFEAVVVERLVAPGQYVREGDVIATLYSVDRMDVRINLPLHQWALLPDINQLIGKEKVVVTSAAGGQWQGVVTQVDQHVDSNSRQRGLVVSVYQPLHQAQPLLAGTFVHVELSGIDHEGLFAVPASSLTGAGDIWYVTNADRLSRFSARIVFQQDGTLFIKAPAALESNPRNVPLAILTLPLPAYVSGQQVRPVYSDADRHERDKYSSETSL